MRTAAKGKTMTKRAGPPPRRRTPVQARARSTVAKIKQASLDLLRDEGADALNTNAIADRAGVNIATVYSYYPDKYSILSELFEEFEQVRSDLALSLLPRVVAGEQSWEEWVHEVISRLAEVRGKDAARVMLRRAMVVTPELLELDLASSARTAKGLCKALQKREGMRAGEAKHVAEIVIDVMTAMLDSAFSVTPPNRKKIQELELMLTAYLDRYATASR